MSTLSSDTPIVPPPSIRLSHDEQEKLYKKIKGTPVEINALMTGLLDPAPVRAFRSATLAFRTNDKDTLKLKDKAVILSMRPEPVLVLGESGTGKELVARIIHGQRLGHFVGVNVCAVTDTLFESELFGHVKGAFTGADKERNGLIRQADNGTLFLDEIGDMPLILQAKILRVLQSQVFRKVGSDFDEPMNCRIVAATHRNIPQMIKDGTFRLDLYERLHVFELRIKPLRDRLEDIDVYVGSEFATVLAQRYEDVTFSGNVRQLMNLKLRYDTFGAEELTGDGVS